MNSVFHTLQREMQLKNVQFRIFSTRHIPKLAEEITALRRDGKISDRVYDKFLDRFHKETPETLPAACAIIVLAMPQGLTRVRFEVEDRTIESVIPATYLWGEPRRFYQEIFERVFTGAGASFARAALPAKLSAAHSGLAKYGRNNICYVEGMGSFARLDTYYTDYPFDVDQWQEKERMEICRTCNQCVQHCPTGAINADQTVIQAHRCLTLFNELSGEFPEWLAPNVHHAVVGCMRCQACCPENRAFLERVLAEETFTNEEMKLLLAGIPKDEVPAELLAKLKRLNMDDYYSVLARNLWSLVESTNSEMG